MAVAGKYNKNVKPYEVRAHTSISNVLKLRKESLLAQSAERAHQLQAESTNALHQTTINAMDIKVRVARKSAAHKPRPSADAVGQRPIANKEAVRRASWKVSH